MSLHRRAAKRDENEPEIVRALEAVGADVRRLSGDGVPDLLVGWRGCTFLLGVKRPDGPKGGKSHGRNRQSGDQRPGTWLGGPWLIVTTVAEALGALGLATSPPVESIVAISQRLDAHLKSRWRTPAVASREGDAAPADVARRRGEE